ncbi:hypothetical protein L226DRAFT_559399 [Lentinus tigrinus ALCF2SS1-7]|uniref:BTB domain-containing protein n=1 Tax=Lentinus tigrinus ALCF2SS1-6 TaxID=1328759 RepID=A0A5C2SL87_9APHY|nr:hypothetical protein L227DRAFT_650290 [Lentinus tigrinus ALCF2SS1-6]RPD76259.1 hypothetical protein L226DRAFT_559399 [Lentinus tigrinus ALCF2SS1-7]
MNVNIPAAGLQMDREFSFSSGNAILIAANVIFQVHTDVLGRHSPALAAQLEASTKFMNGRPVLRVTDTPYDLRQALCVVYGFYGTTKQDSFSHLAACVSIGTKYGMEELVDRAITQLEPLFPANLSEWDKRAHLETRLGFRNEDAIVALNLFQQTRQFPLIPAAVYRCCQLDPYVILHGVTRTDGTPERLSSDSVQLVFRAQAELRKHGAQMIEECRELKPSEWCSFAWAFDGCREVVSDLAHTRGDGKEAWRDGDPLDGRFLEYIDEQRDTGPGGYESRDEFADCMGACATCIRQVRRQVSDMRARVWNDLPELAGVQDEIEDWAYDD